VLWLGIAVLSLWLARRFTHWASDGFPYPGRAVVTVVFAYVTLAIAIGLSMEFVGRLLGPAALETGGEERSPVSTAIGLSVSGLSLTLAGGTVAAILRRRHIGI
jgi:hypothetical protein